MKIVTLEEAEQAAKRFLAKAKKVSRPPTDEYNPLGGYGCD